LAAQCEHGLVKLVEGSWNQAFIDELCAFPNGVHDDQVDASSAAFRAVMCRVTYYMLAA
jgi:predicted phage terminase large subunit-like protein